MELDCLIKNGLILTGAPGDSHIPDGFVAIKQGLVHRFGPMEELPPETNPVEMIDASGCLVMPGLINTHTHAAMTLMRGLADDLPLMTWLNDYIFPAEAAHVKEDLVYWGSKLACAEMLLSGTTGFVDGYFLEDQTARAVRESGLRAILGQGVVDFPAPGVPDPAKNLETASGFIERNQGHPLVSPSIFCHSPYTCSARTLTKGKEMAGRLGVLFQIHVAETAAEVERIEAETGMTPVRYLDSLGVLDESTLAVHCVHLDEEDVEILAARRTPVSVCLESEMKLSSGLPPVARMMDKGCRLSLGTDGPASNNDLNLFGEMRTLAFIYKGTTLDPTILPAGRVLNLAGPAGAEAVGWSNITGTIAPGKAADLIVVDLKSPHLTPLYHPESHLVYAASGRETRDVLVNGKIVVKNRRITTFDLEETMSKVREKALEIRLEKDGPTPR